MGDVLQKMMMQVYHTMRFVLKKVELFLMANLWLGARYGNDSGTSPP